MLSRSTRPEDTGRSSGPCTDLLDAYRHFAILQLSLVHKVQIERESLLQYVVTHCYILRSEAFNSSLRRRHARSHLQTQPPFRVPPD